MDRILTKYYQCVYVGTMLNVTILKSTYLQPHIQPNHSQLDR